MSIDRREAAAALSDIDDITRRVRQSRIYQISSLMLMLWGPLVMLGYIVLWLRPTFGGYAWAAIDLVGIAGTFAISVRGSANAGRRSFDLRGVVAFVLFIAFGFIWSVGMGTFTPRQIGAFWASYLMLAYTLAGLWLGRAFVAIGLGVTALTLVGYFFAGSWFNLWMAAVYGGGLLLGGYWMRHN